MLGFYTRVSLSQVFLNKTSFQNIRKRPFYFMSGKRKVSLSVTRICSDLRGIHPELEIKEQKYTAGAALELTMSINNYR